jgi:50S ribosomal protein L16 3-hydroxylase
MLGNLTTKIFLRDYWQKKPLLVRQAFPKFKGLLDSSQLLALACAEDAQSRLVIQHRDRWQVKSGSLEAAEFDGLEKAKWTVLVQGINHHLPDAASLLMKFNFIPYARLDDLMVSYAPKGGGVGPHFDSYDVFLLQGLGQRRWQISAQQDRSLISGAPLKILQNFKAEEEWVLESGDMLYLPPGYAHNGIAENECMTYSVGFRAPTHQELAEQFLVFLQDRVCLDGMYSDPDLMVQDHPSEISVDMVHQVSEVIKQIQWDSHDVANFLGGYLSDPKPHVFFDPPKRPLNQERFMGLIGRRGLMADQKTQMLCHQGVLFVNGIAHAVSAEAYQQLRTFADARQLGCVAGLSKETLNLLYEWYVDGYIMPCPGLP